MVGNLPRTAFKVQPATVSTVSETAPETAETGETGETGPETLDAGEDLGVGKWTQKEDNSHANIIYDIIHDCS